MGAIVGAALKWIVGPIAGPLFGSLLVVSLLANVVSFAVQRWQIADLRGEKAALELRIDAPGTGYVARAAQCETNVAQLSDGIGQLNKGIDALAAASKASGDRAAADMKQATKDAKDIAANSLKVLAFPKPADPAQACLQGAHILSRGTP